MLDRSPCGTGTCAEVALRYARGQLGLGEPFVTESIIGTRFTAQVIAETQVGSGSEATPAVIPEVTGSAYITGYHQFVLDGEDPFPQGFWLKA
jgi:proline racemase